MSTYSLNTTSFYKALDDGKLIGSRCQDCGYVAVPQRQICPKCYSDQMEVIEFSGKGKLAAYTVIFVPPTEMLQAGHDGKNPYCTGIVELVEGPRVNAQILGVNLLKPSTIKIGTQLQMTTIEKGLDDKKHEFLAFQVL